MASQDHIRNPIEWGWDQVTLATLTVGSLGRSLGGSELGQRSRRFRGVSDRRFLPLHHSAPRSHHRHARARARHLAPVPQGGGAEHVAIGARQCP
jgi:hypothetical protein